MIQLIPVKHIFVWMFDGHVVIILMLVVFVKHLMNVKDGDTEIIYLQYVRQNVLCIDNVTLSN